MKKIIKNILMVSSLCVAISAYADDSFYSASKVSYVNSTISDVSANGRAVLTKTKVTGNVHVNGRTELTDTTVAGDVRINGATMFDGATVAGKTKINGKLEAKDSSLQDLNVNGSVTLEKTQVKGAAYINGSLRAKDSSFSKVIDIASNNIFLESTTTTDITVRESDSQTQQTIALLDHSKINGSINFEQGNGIVYVSKDSNITGKVTGGTIVNK